MAHYAFVCTIADAIATTNGALPSELTQWAGFADDAARDHFEANGYSLEAVDAMRAAQATLASTERGAQLQAATVGAWDIPSVLAGLPMCATRRAIVPASPLAVRVNICANSATNAAQIAMQTARLANAIRAEILKGRAISVTVEFNAVVRKKPFGKYARGDTVRISCPVDATRDDQLATALSMQFYRNALVRTNDMNPMLLTAFDVTGAINFGDDEAQMMRQLNAILAA